MGELHWRRRPAHKHSSVYFAVHPLWLSCKIPQRKQNKNTATPLKLLTETCKPTSLKMNFIQEQLRFLLMFPHQPANKKRHIETLFCVYLLPHTVSRCHRSQRCNGSSIHWHSPCIHQTWSIYFCCLHSCQGCTRTLKTWGTVRIP